MITVTIESVGKSLLLSQIPNGTFFTGTIAGYVSAGPFLKVGSISAKTWIVVKLEAMEGCVWASSRDDETSVGNYAPLSVREVVLRAGA